MRRKLPFKSVFERMSTEQLDEILQAELHAEHPDDEAVRMILAVLRDREKDVPVEMTAEIKEVWKDYQRDKPVRRVVSPGLLRAAAVGIVVLITLVSVPYANADVAEYFTRWTDSVYEFIVPGAIRNEKEFIFETDHAGLQEIYDTAVSLGIEKPMVPTWLPGETVLTECKVSKTPHGKRIYADLSNDEYNTVFAITVFDKMSPHEHQKDKSAIRMHEVNGVQCVIQRNNDMWVVFWIIDNVEYVLTLNCSEVYLYESLDSMYA